MHLKSHNFYFKKGRKRKTFIKNSIDQWDDYVFLLFATAVAVSKEGDFSFKISFSAIETLDKQYVDNYEIAYKND